MASLKRQRGSKLVPRIIEKVESLETIGVLAKIRKAAFVAAPHNGARDGAAFDFGSTLNAKHVIFGLF